MVIDRSELSRSRTGIHGGLRRGAAAAAVGAVLVLSAGVPASHAADGSTDPTEPVRLAAGTDLTSGDGLLKGLLGAVTASPEPSPSAPSTTAPATTAPATTAPASTAPAPTSTAAPVPTSAPPSSFTAPQGAVPAGTVPPSAAPAPLRAPVPGIGAPAEGPGTQAGQPTAPLEAGGAAPEDAGHPGPTSGQSTSRSSEATPVSGPKRSGNASAGQQQMGAAEAEPTIEAAKIWLGVGLVGSAGAAGLLFARIRRI